MNEEIRRVVLGWLNGIAWRIQGRRLQLCCDARGCYACLAETVALMRHTRQL